jgi:hypothetical protein
MAPVDGPGRRFGQPGGAGAGGPGRESGGEGAAAPPRSGWQSAALAACLVLGIALGGTMARSFYSGASPSETGAEVASLEVFHDFPQGSLGAVVASYQPEEGNGNQP